MSAFADAVVKTILDRHLAPIPVYTVIPAAPALEYVYATHIGGGGDIDPRWRGIVATIRCDFVSRFYWRSFELSELVREAFLTAEARNEHTPDGYFAHFRIYVPPNRIQIPRSPEDEWRFTALYGVVIS